MKLGAVQVVSDGQRALVWYWSSFNNFYCSKQATTNVPYLGFFLFCVWPGEFRKKDCVRAMTTQIL